MNMRVQRANQTGNRYYEKLVRQQQDDREPTEIKHHENIIKREGNV